MARQSVEKTLLALWIVFLIITVILVVMKYGMGKSISMGSMIAMILVLVITFITWMVVVIKSNKKPKQ